MNDNDIEWDKEKHNKRIGEYSDIANFINEIIEIDYAIKKFSNKNNLNQIGIVHLIYRVIDKYFIFCIEDFIEECNENDLNDILKQLFFLLVDYNIFRKVDDNDYLISEKAFYYTYIIRGYRISEFEHCLEYIKVDSMPVIKAIEYHKSRYESDGYSSEAFLKYYGYEEITYTFSKE